MTFEAKRAIAEILFTAEERLLGKDAFYVLESWVFQYFEEWGWYEPNE